MGKEKHRAFSAERKVEILRCHLVDKTSVSDLCDEYKIQLSLFYNWLRQMAPNMSAALMDGRSPYRSDSELEKDQARIAALKAKVARKGANIADISEEDLQLKERLGWIEWPLGAA